MSKVSMSAAALLVALSFAGTMSFAESGTVYKAKCQSCHGSTGIPNPGIAKSLGVKAANDPSVKKMTEAQMAAVVKNGSGKMKAVAGLTDAQIKESVAYYKSLGK